MDKAILKRGLDSEIVHQDRVDALKVVREAQSRKICLSLQEIPDKAKPYIINEQFREI